MEAWGWPTEQQQAFLQLQYRAQQQAYRVSYEGATLDVIICEGEPAGRIIVRRSELEILGVDIALLPEYRDRGIGSRLIDELKAEATASGRPFVFQVHRSNPSALRLYQRLGFVVIGANDITLTLEWKPEAAG